jgi:hypothetical protein
MRPRFNAARTRIEKTASRSRSPGSNSPRDGKTVTQATEDLRRANVGILGFNLGAKDGTAY